TSGASNRYGTFTLTLRPIAHCEVPGQDHQMKKLSVFCAFAALTLVCYFTPRPVFGQAVYGSIFGTLTDPSGAAVANAKVTVTSATKGTSVETTTNGDGNYSVTHLIPDVYNVRGENAGFKAFEAKNIQVSADAAA